MPPDCPEGTVLCNNLTCSDLRTDPYNCGYCENACGQGLSCKYTDAGIAPDAGFVDGGVTTGVVYVGSACQCTIPDAIFWNGFCYDLSVDPQNCGSIGFSCGNTQVCFNGVCGCAGVDAGGGPIVACPGDAGPICTDLRVDPHHCGVCGNDCGDNADCDSSVCVPLDAGAIGDSGPDAGSVDDGGFTDGGDAGLSDAGPDAGDGGDGGP